ncbi:hypothetical protein PoB_005169400 [Plakobranchus ocellatus]|uniref:Uncharacterized protein n=1 Tax=Plakobranchus ocellatus TaxID=259542 RepID=A0AAV4BY87_9GAST|nr:hypothetical protein PoB_005169400 [Plakobranchus ocellatus]
MKVNVEVYSMEDLLHIPAVGEKTAQKIVKLRDDNPFTLQSLCDLVRKDPMDYEELVSFDFSPSSYPKAVPQSYGLSWLRKDLPLCVSVSGGTNQEVLALWGTC